MKPNKQQIAKHRVITMLERKELEFLDKLGKDSLFTTGHKLSYNIILRGLINLAMEIGLSGEKIDSMAALKEKMLRILQDQIHKEVQNEKTSQSQ